MLNSFFTLIMWQWFSTGPTKSHAGNQFVYLMKYWLNVGYYRSVLESGVCEGDAVGRRLIKR